jgi:CRISPR-associated endonuclease Cas1 subtype II
MGWRTIVITGSAKLEYKLDYLVIRKSEGVARIHMGEIEMLIVESTSASLTTRLIYELTRFKIKVMFCDQQHNPSSELVPYYGSHDVSAKIKQQLRWTEETKLDVWTAIVKEKINNQKRHLLLRNKTREAYLLDTYISELLPGDVTNREGHAAKVYFNALFGMDFKRSESNALNAVLDYGYGVLLAHFNREIAASGYLTQMGLFHNNQFNYFNLSSDLMEPFRVFVDKHVYDLAPSKFETEEKQNILFSFTESVFIDGKRREIPAAIRVYCRSVFAALNSGNEVAICFYKDEL